MSHSNFPQTNGFVSKNPNSDFNRESYDSTSIQETAGFSESASSQPSGTGAIKKVNNGLTCNREKPLKNGYAKNKSNKRVPFNIPHKKSQRSSFCDDEQMPYNDFKSWGHRNQRDNNHYKMPFYDEHYEGTYNNKGYRQNLSRQKNPQYVREIHSNDSMFERNGKFRNGNVTNSDHHNSDTSSRKPENISSYEECSNVFKSNRYWNYKGSRRNFRHYNEETTYEDSNAPISNKNGQYQNGRDKNTLLLDEPLQRNFDRDRFTGNRNHKHNGRMAYFNQKKHRNNGKGLKNNVEIASQRERLEGMIKQRILECLVCCELLKHNNEVWSCKQCYHILHLKCTQAWAKSSKIENGWRCPACQNVCKDIPAEYLCFCGKQKNPRNVPGFIAHSCGEICLKDRRNCDHRCSILCHPGPCPDCTILVDKSCGCGKTKQQVMCSSEVEITCASQCDKLLKCGIHKCEEKCHIGDCKPCIEILHQICYCKKKSRDVTCSFETKGNEEYSCGGSCEKDLRCGNHKCQRICHSGSCNPCSKDCDIIKTCFCGKMALEVPRKSCLDPIPSCGMLCQKLLKCGPSNEHHKCESPCHDGDCPPCNLSTFVRCRCGSMNKEIPCHKLIDDDGRCERKCTKKRLCGKHKCNQRCCIEIEHVCPLPCNRTLSCGNHRCELTCHSGRCKPCMETSFDELFCECGANVTYPPIPCGTKPPVCDKPCSRPRDCGHEVNHACHTGPCPPCTVLCKRWCYGNHEQRGAIPCHQEEFSCGLPCGKPIHCGRHKCISPCHLGTCPTPCKQPCVFERSSCGHPCLATCHEPPCPQSNCKSKVAVSCICGVQKGVRSCNDVINEIRNIELAQLSEKMLNMSKNQSVDMTDLKKPKRPDVLKILECTEECRVIERNRRLAIGLQIRNPDISQKLTPRYSDFMKGWAKKDPHFCQRVHDRLTELVQLAKQSQQKSRAHSFESMNRDKRQFVHEYCEHFGCESEAYDAEPNRNVVATAIRDKSWLPSMSVLEVIQRENGQRKVPMPTNLERNLCSQSESVTLKPLSRTYRSSVQTNDVEYSKK
ncbi:protein shuttle craft-like [Coccinella septempunctata]|uniref:protein shuttle craft-like n=1 Tax=Coccinella septempunctata TaxID=41139 RepID=UPI001D082365|nr:protein shuttle craft-like [Coccinella septempunctata]XP_044750761.1 protein shuttle craft-like [Coccinella septempunctata]XP_044750762.1 protein shuttle craft-like [Coccinella septempunctata]